VKKNLNKSDAIREHLRSSRNHNPTAVVKALKAKGISVSRGLVSVVKHSRRKSEKASRIGRHAAILTQARHFLREAGGPEEAKQLIDLIHGIIS
jgi:hypothetical protein